MGGGRGSASIRDVAERAGVSIGTVSNVLNRPDRVSPRAQARVRAAIADLGFVRNESARQLRSGRARTIGLVLLDVGNPFFTDLARGVEDAATESGRVVILCNSDSSAEREQRHLDTLAEQRVFGVLIVPVNGELSAAQQLRERGVAVVLVDHPAPSGELCSVAVDDVTGGRLAITHLLAEGYERITMVNGPSSLRQTRDRYEGARAGLRRAGRDPDALEQVVVPAFTVAAGRSAGEELLARRVRPQAVFCGNDLLAVGVLQTLLHAGVAVPDEMAVMGYDDIDFAAAAAVPLSSVRQPRHLLGRTAAQLIISEADDPAHEHEHVVFTPEVVVRDSTRRHRRPARFAG